MEVVGSTDKNLSNARATGYDVYASLDEMLDAAKPDIVDIITPPETHLELIQKALSSDIKAIICQKAFCQNIEEARTAADLSHAHGIPIIVHENFRFQPWYRVMKQHVELGTLGRIHQLTFTMRTGDGQGPDAYLERQPYFQKMKRFLVHETGVHWIDTFRYLLGEPKAVYADLRKMNCHISGEDAGFIVMDFANDSRALLDANRNLDHVSENHRLTFGECRLEGELGTISLDGSGEVSLRKFGTNASIVLLPAQHWPGFAGDCVHALQTHVVNALENDIPFENTARDYLEVIEIEQAVYESARQGIKKKV